MILEILIYKAISKAFFLNNCYSSQKKDISVDIKKWNFSWYHLLYYLVTIIAIIRPLIKNPIILHYFLWGLIPVCTSLFLIIFCNLSKKSLHVELIDFLFIEGVSIQINSWLCSLIGFIYLFLQIYFLTRRK
jgi:hypothetical protein